MRFFKSCLMAMLFLFFAGSHVFAASTTNKYQVTLTKCELYNGASWVTVFDADVSGTTAQLDIASVGTNQSVGNFISGLSVPDGTYTRARATPSTTFVIRGSVVDGATTYYTTATTASAGGRTVSVATTTAANIADCTVTVLASDISVGDGVAFSGGSLTVTNGQPSHRVRVSFNLSDAVTYVSGNIYPGPPTITITLVSN